MHVYIYIYTYICICMCMCIYIYIYIYMQSIHVFIQSMYYMTYNTTHDDILRIDPPPTV